MGCGALRPDRPLRIRPERSDRDWARPSAHRGSRLRGGPRAVKPGAVELGRPATGGPVSLSPVLPVISATTYLTPLREGGSLPGLVEADDLGTYVVKFTAAGQGAKALVAEIVVGE